MRKTRLFSFTEPSFQEKFAIMYEGCSPKEKQSLLEDRNVVNFVKKTQMLKTEDGILLQISLAGTPLVTDLHMLRQTAGKEWTDNPYKFFMMVNDLGQPYNYFDPFKSGNRTLCIAKPNVYCLQPHLAMLYLDPEERNPNVIRPLSEAENCEIHILCDKERTKHIRKVMKFWERHSDQINFGKDEADEKEM